MLTYLLCAFGRLSTADDGKHYPIAIMYVLYLSFECTSADGLVQLKNLTAIPANNT